MNRDFIRNLKNGDLYQYADNFFCYCGPVPNYKIPEADHLEVCGLNSIGNVYYYQYYLKFYCTFYNKIIFLTIDGFEYRFKYYWKKI